MGNYQNKKMRNYFRIFEQLYENPGTITYKLSENIAQNYREYVAVIITFSPSWITSRSSSTSSAFEEAIMV
jgi:hypothetical protein